MQAWPLVGRVAELGSLGRMNTIAPRTLRKRIGKGLLIVLGAYVILYVLNSLMGGYWLGAAWDRPRNDGPSTRERMNTAGVMWQPQFGHNVVGKFGDTDFLGYFFAPLIAIDRAWVHRTHLIADSDFASWSQSVPLTEVHPKQRHHFTERR